MPLRDSDTRASPVDILERPRGGPGVAVAGFFQIALSWPRSGEGNMGTESADTKVKCLHSSWLPAGADAEPRAMLPVSANTDAKPKEAAVGRACRTAQKGSTSLQ